MPANTLYLVAALPGESLEKEVWAWKRLVAERYGAVRGLRVLPHVTFIPPFAFDPRKEPAVAEALQQAVSGFTPYDMALDGFGHFKGAKSYTIYIHVEDQAVIQQQHRHLNLYARQSLMLPAQLTPVTFTPHMTIAYRDLSRERFELAWPDFEHRTFRAVMPVRSLWLLRHNGYSWDRLKELTFAGD